MASYKVPQDVEAEDKLLGPLTLKQFIFSIITILLGYLAFLFGRSNFLLALPFLPPIGLFGYLAAPFARDQPTDVYLGARLRFLFKPRRRIWDQSGMEELVKITVPKKIEHQYTNNLQPGEVRSRLQILASTIDSRGWATKNAYVNDPSATIIHPDEGSDRLIAVSDLPHNVPDTDITPADDMLDPDGSRIAYHMDQLAAQATTAVRDEALAQMKAVQANPQSYQPTTVAPTPQVITPTKPMPKNDSSLRYDPYPSNMRQHVLDPSGRRVPPPPRQPATPSPSSSASPAVEQTPKATTSSLPESAKLGLAQRDDLSVDAIAREANRVANGDSEEVVIKLH